VTLLTVWLGVGSLFFDNHAVRAIEESRPIQTEFAQAILAWHAAAQAAYGRDDPPLVVVSTAGGGLRAAYWTATVLGALQDHDANFDKSLLAVSGVSGGSLGATVFVTTLGLSEDQRRQVKGCSNTDRQYECIGQKVLAQDFLAPAVAGLLFPDLIYKFLPVFSDGHDRAAAMEKGWERAWSEVGLNDGTWAGRGFTTLWSGNARLPALLLNGTDVTTGKRIVTSNLRIGGIPLVDTYDAFRDILEVDVPVSTGVHNSARFILVSPPGTLHQRGTGAQRGQIVDGGYFENSGATTALEVLDAARGVLEDARKRYRPFVIQITNDSSVPPMSLDSASATVPSPREARLCRDEILGPVCAVLSTRGGHGSLASKRFAGAVGETDQVHFKLCERAREPALGWVLSEESNRAMQELVRSNSCGNGASLTKVLTFAASAS
jgi:hypothetical protein